MASETLTTPQSIPPREGEDAATVTSTTALVGSVGSKDTSANEDTPSQSPLQGNLAPQLPKLDPQPPIPTDDASQEKSAPEGETIPTPPETQAPTPQLNLQVPQTHQTYITFLFLSGRRRLMNFEPDTTIGRVKELVWAAWTAAPSEGQQPGQEVEERPPAPSYLRVLHLGRMLQDDETLRDLKLPTHLPSSTPTASPVSPGTAHGHAPISTIMHLSIRPFPPPGEVDTGKKSGRAFGRGSDRASNSGAPDPGDNANTGCCGCVIC